jgi:cytosine/adenosine deaminase-related metal-dependent hydrolase
MLLRNLYSVSHGANVDIRISGTKLDQVIQSGEAVQLDPNSQGITFENAIVFPGLINSHDHLDFNVFPRLGNRLYPSYVEWGTDIHKSNKSVIDNVLKIPLELRVLWGIYKNLLNGITTVVNHGPPLKNNDGLIKVFQNCKSIHSVQLEKNWILKLNRPGREKTPYVFHIGEGTDSASKNEIKKLLRWNLFHKKLIGIHAVAMKRKQASRFEAIVWCPFSNQFLLGQTADISELKKQTKIIFGTDSTVSADWNIWEHFRMALNYKVVSEQELYHMVTDVPARVWELNNLGQLQENFVADIVIARRKKELNGLDAFFTLNPEDILMVIREGAIVLYDESIRPLLQHSEQEINGFSRIYLNENLKFVKGDLPDLINRIKEFYPGISFPVTTA